MRFVDKNLMREMEAVAVNKKLPAGAVMMNPGDVIQYIPIVLKGSLRILLQNENGDERFLYHIYPDETCALSLSCCQAHKLSEIKAVAEEDTQVMMVPVRYLDEWMKYPEWKKYVSDTQAQRFTELLETIERVAFSKLDEQLWSYLVKRVQATGNPVLKITHQQIANELNSPREVITRLLHQLASQKRVTLARNLVEVHVLK